MFPIAWRSAGIAAASSFVVLMLFAGRYGYHRDELYFLACAKRLAWGFVDQPPLTPVIARLSQAVAPGSLVFLRMWPALFMATVIVLTVLTARELGAGRLGQVAVAVATATCPGVYAAGHLLSTTTLDIALWVALTLVVLRYPAGKRRPALAGGGVLIGIGLLNKWTIGFLVVGLLFGIVLGAERRLLANGWFVTGVAIALVLMGAEPLVAGFPRLASAPDVRRSPADELWPRADDRRPPAIRHQRVPRGGAVDPRPEARAPSGRGRAVPRPGIAYVSLGVTLRSRPETSPTTLRLCTSR